MRKKRDFLLPKEIEPFYFSFLQKLKYLVSFLNLKKNNNKNKFFPVLELLLYILQILHKNVGNSN